MLEDNLKILNQYKEKNITFGDIHDLDGGNNSSKKQLNNLIYYTLILNYCS